jgi:transposase
LNSHYIFIRRYGKIVSMRRQQEAAFKAKVALEAVKGEKAIAQIASEDGLHSNLTRQRRAHLLDVIEKGE